MLALAAISLTAFAPVVVHDADERYRGRWGAARARWWIPGEQDSPVGPAFQRGQRWSDPDAFAASARSCQSDCNRVNACDAPERGLALAAAAVPAALLLLLRRRRHSPGNAS